MSSKPETGIYRGVHNWLERLKPTVYSEKMYNPLRGGTPDMYYEYRRSLWVEYKYAKLPLRDSSLVIYAVSDLQEDWLMRQYKNGLEPWVIVGTHNDKHKPMGAILKLPREWRSGMKCGPFRAKLMTLEGIAQAIQERVQGEIPNPKKR